MSSAAEHLRGHPIEYRGGRWVYIDTGEPTAETWRDRPCGHCGLQNTPEGHDGCLGELPREVVMNACCGHGNAREAYVQYRDRTDVRGPEALAAIEELQALPTTPAEVVRGEGGGA